MHGICTQAERYLIRRIDRARLTDAALAAARTATTISHPNVASVYELAEDELGPYIVTEFVAGDALDKVLGGRPMNPRRALEVAAQLADGLAEVHSLGLVHGDIRPATVAITPKGQVKLFDVGVPLAGNWHTCSCGCVIRQDTRRPRQALCSSRTNSERTCSRSERCCTRCSSASRRSRWRPPRIR